MAKSESTAVNELISLVQGGSRRDEPSQDLFAQPKSTRAPSPAPLERAPTGTSQLHLNNGKPVRMMTAPPTRSQSIPPLPQAQPRATQPPPPRPSIPRASSPRAQQLVPPPRPSTEAPTVPKAAPVAPLPQAARPTVPSAAKLPTPNRPSPRASGQHAAVDPARAAMQQPAQPSTLAEPPTAPVRPAAKKPTPSNAIPAARTTPSKSSPIEQRVYGAPAYERAAIDKTGDPISADNWFEASRVVEKIDETWVGTSPAAKQTDHSAAIKRVLLPLVVLSVVSAGVAYVVFAHHGKKVAPPVTHVTAPAQKTSAPADQTAPIPSTESPNAATASAGGVQPEPPMPAVAPAQNEAAMTPHPNANEQKIVANGEAPAAAPAPAPAPPQVAETAPVVHEVQSAHGVVKLVDVRIDSKPAGATVMLVDNGKTQFLGTTPVAASVDPSRSYDVVLTLEGRPTQITHLDPNKTQKLEIALAKSGPAKAETPKAPARVSHVSHARRASAPAGGIVDPGFDSPKAEAPADEPKAEAPKAEGGKGTLMVSSKPPCEIWIDGNDSGLTTPQRAMSLPAGAHKVTFVNGDQNITKTVSVMITSGEATKLIQNLLSN